MKLSEVAIRLMGLALAIIGFAVILAAVGIANVVQISPTPDWLLIIMGMLMIGGGVVLIRGGNITV